MALYSGMFVVTGNDDTMLQYKGKDIVAQRIQVWGAGNLAFLTVRDTVHALTGVPVGFTIDAPVKKVLLTGTTATLIIAYF